MDRIVPKKNPSKTEKNSRGDSQAGFDGRFSIVLDRRSFDRDRGTLLGCSSLAGQRLGLEPRLLARLRRPTLLGLHFVGQPSSNPELRLCGLFGNHRCRDFAAGSGPWPSGFRHLFPHSDARSRVAASISHGGGYDSAWLHGLALGHSRHSFPSLYVSFTGSTFRTVEWATSVSGHYGQHLYLANVGGSGVLRGKRDHAQPGEDRRGRSVQRSSNAVRVFRFDRRGLHGDRSNLDRKNSDRRFGHSYRHRLQLHSNRGDGNGVRVYRPRNGRAFVPRCGRVVDDAAWLCHPLVVLAIFDRLIVPEESFPTANRRT